MDGFSLVLVPKDGFAYVLNGRPVAASSTSECLLSLALTSAAEVDTWGRRALDAGAETIAAAEARPWGYTAIVADPDGHAWEVSAPGD